MARTTRSTTRVGYQLKVTLKGSKPPIWRRMQVTSDTTLVKLHRILQRVMGWEGSHLYQFVIGGVAYGDPGLLGELEAEDARLVTLETIVRGEQFKFLYEYDFGDSWEHELRIEKTLPLEEGKRYRLPHRQTRLSTGGLRWHLGIREFSGSDPRSDASRA